MPCHTVWTRPATEHQGKCVGSLADLVRDFMRAPDVRPIVRTAAPIERVAADPSAAAADQIFELLDAAFIARVAGEKLGGAPAAATLELAEDGDRVPRVVAGATH